MKVIKILKHAGIIIAGILVTVGIPLWCTGYIRNMLSGNVNVVSSASIVLDQPSGDYIVLINKAFHTDEKALQDWIRFFGNGTKGEELLVIFEDIACSVAVEDAPGAKMADSLCSQLPENQMKVTREDDTLLLSRAEAGLFDVIIMSKEFAEAGHAETVYKDGIEVVELKSR